MEDTKAMTADKEDEQAKIPTLTKAYLLKDGRVIPASELDRYKAVQSTEEKRRSKEKVGKEFDYKKDALVEPPYTLSYLIALLEKNTDHYRCTKAKTDDTIGLDFSVVPAEGLEVDKANKEEGEKVKKFFRECGGKLPFITVMNRIVMDLNSTGSGYMEVTRDSGGEIVNVFHVPCASVRIKRNGGYIQKVGQQKIHFQEWGEKYERKESKLVPKVFINAGDGKQQKDNEQDFLSSATELVHFTNYHPGSPYYGLPDVIPAIGAVVGNICATTYNITFFENNAVPAYAVIIKGADLSKELETAITEFFSAELKGKPHRTLIIPVPFPDVEVKLEPLATEIKDESFTLYRKSNRDEILRAHGVHPARIGIIETGQLGAGCIRKGSRVWSSFFGLSKIEDVCERLGYSEPRMKLSTIALDPNDGKFHRAKILKAWKFQLRADETRGIVTELGTCIETSNWHLFFVKEAGRFVEKRSDELEIGDLVAAPVLEVERNNLPMKHLNNRKTASEVLVRKAWLAGFAQGDGCLTGSIKKGMTFGLYAGRNDEYLLDVADEIIQEFGVFGLTSQKRTGPHLTVKCQRYGGSIGVMGLAEDLGVERAPKVNLRIPAFVSRGSACMMRAWLAGLLDSDGCVESYSKGRYRLYWSTSCESLAEDIMAITHLLGFKSRLVIKEPGNVSYIDGRAVVTKRVNYCIYISGGRQVKRARTSFMSHMQCKRKIAAFESMGKIRCRRKVDDKKGLVRVADILPGRGGEYYDFTVDKFQNYLAGSMGLVVVHNSGLSQQENYKNSIVEPAQHVIEHQLNHTLVKEGLGVESWKFKFQDLDIRDRTQEVKMGLDELKAGAISINEFRIEVLGKKEIPGGEHHVIFGRGEPLLVKELGKLAKETDHEKDINELKGAQEALEITLKDLEKSLESEDSN